MSILNRLKNIGKNGAPEDESEIQKLTIRAQAPKKPKTPFAFTAALSLGVVAVVTKAFGMGASVSAEVINTTEIIEMITSMASIFPSMGNLVVAIVPTLLILAIVAFLLGFFDSILDAIQGAMKFSRR